MRGGGLGGSTSPPSGLGAYVAQMSLLSEVGKARPKVGSRTRCPFLIPPSQPQSPCPDDRASGRPDLSSGFSSLSLAYPLPLPCLPGACWECTEMVADKGVREGEARPELRPGLPLPHMVAPQKDPNSTGPDSSAGTTVPVPRLGQSTEDHPEPISGSGTAGLGPIARNQP